MEEVDLARNLVGGEPAAHELLQLAPELRPGCGARHRDDEGLHDLAPDGVGNADRGRDRDRVMPDQAFLDLARADAVAGARDQVVAAAEAAEGAVVAELGQVARVEQAVPHLRGGGASSRQ